MDAAVLTADVRTAIVATASDAAYLHVRKAAAHTELSPAEQVASDHSSAQATDLMERFLVARAGAVYSRALPEADRMGCFPVARAGAAYSHALPEADHMACSLAAQAAVERLVLDEAACPSRTHRHSQETRGHQPARMLIRTTRFEVRVTS